MEVCQICGALLANDSTGARIDAHMIGKQHMGFIRIRKTLEEHAVYTFSDNLIYIFRKKQKKEEMLRLILLQLLLILVVEITETEQEITEAIGTLEEVVEGGMMIETLKDEETIGIEMMADTVKDNFIQSKPRNSL
jgi:hypothetical protein